MRQNVRASAAAKPAGGDGVPVRGGERPLAQLDAPELELVHDGVPGASEGTLGDLGLHESRMSTMAAMQSSMVSASSLALGLLLRPFMEGGTSMLSEEARRRSSL